MAAESILIGRNAPPSHYMIKIESFSLLQTSINVFSSEEFDAGGYKWKMSIYPTGNYSRNGKDHISIYLELVQTSSLPAGWEVNVIIKFFIFNHLQDKYFSNKDCCENRYHKMNTLFGIVKFIDLETFSNPVNGYLYYDTCIFGVEVFVVKNTLQSRCLSMINEPITYFHTWEVYSFSYLVEESYMSKSFGGYKWKIMLYPGGRKEGKGNSISIFLSQTSFPSDTNLVVKFILRIKDQKNGKHVEFKDNHLFAPNASVWGCDRFLSFSKLEYPNNGFLLYDNLIIEANVTLLGLQLANS